MIKMMFVTPDVDRARTWDLLSNKLREKGIECNFVTYSREVYLFFEKKSKECIYLADEIDKIKVRGDLKKHLAKIEAKYDIPSLELFLIGDLEHSKMERERAYPIMIKHFYFWEDYLRKNKVDFIVGGIERFVHMIPREVSKKYKTRYLGTELGPLAGRFSLTTDPFYLSALIEYWKKNKDRKLTEQEKKRAVQFIREFRRKLEKPFAARAFSAPKINMRKIKFFLNRLHASLFIEKGRFPYMDVSGGTYRYFLRIFRAKAAKKYYSEFDPREDYVFYPFHLSHDLQLRVKAPQFIDQPAAIENIAKSLPGGYKLYVKEHPADIGGTSVKDLEKISKLPNVKLLRPSENPLKIIKHSACIVTINSGVGWEALLLRKPVINLGKVFYELSGLTYPIRDFYELPKTVKLALRKNPVKEDVLVKFVNAVLATTYLGDLFRTSLYFSEDTRADVMDSPENIEDVAAGICNEVRKWGHTLT